MKYMIHRHIYVQIVILSLVFKYIFFHKQWALSPSEIQKLFAP
jgi:hypothetical protein